ncbi:MAG: hypothetical protein CMN56_05295 [Sneathiella sp.]|nr:hypothetical protein [Sneathiella sp.]
MPPKDSPNKILNTLCCDYDLGEGSVNISEKFGRQSVLFQLDVIEDWIADLEFYRDTALGGPFDDILEEISEQDQAEVIDLASRRKAEKEVDNED